MFSSAGPQVAVFTGYWLSLCQPNSSSIKILINCDRRNQESELIKVHASKFKNTGFIYLYCYKFYLFINTCNTYRYYYNDIYNDITITIIFINNVYLFILFNTMEVTMVALCLQHLHFQQR